MSFHQSMEKSIGSAYDQIGVLSLSSVFSWLSPPVLARTSRAMSNGTGEGSGSSHVPGSPWKDEGLVGHGDFRVASWLS